MRFIHLILFVCLAVPPAFGENVVLMNGTIIDGTGKARIIGNVRIRDGKITDVGVFKPAAGETLIDVKGMIVAPGFIDLESFSIPALQKDPGAPSEIAQGFTTAILGADGSGPYLIEEFMLPFDEKPPAINIAMLIGHNTIRRQIMGPDYKRAAKPDEVQRMGELIIEAGRQGAFGLALDLRNEPASFSTTDELLALAKAVDRSGGTFLMHPRDESLKEALDISRVGKILIQISLARPSDAVFADINKARMQGVDIAAHLYDYSEPGRELRSLLQNAFTAISFAEFTRDDKAITLERAIQKMTGLPASRFGLRERGALRKGIPADLVVFNPMALTTGMKYVFVNGTLVVKEGQPTGAHPGQALR